MIARADIVNEARRWIGTPFAHQASVIGVGCDCIGLVVGVVSALGLSVAGKIKADPRFHGYGPLPNGGDLRAACDEHAERISPYSARAGDVLLLSFLREPMHVAIVSNDSPMYIVHGYQPIGRVVENIIDVKWFRRIIGAYRLREVC